MFLNKYQLCIASWTGIFSRSLIYRHTMYPVRFKPCVQWTPTKESITKQNTEI